jgi:hypothetical protein
LQSDVFRLPRPAEFENELKPQPGVTQEEIGALLAQIRLQPRQVFARTERLGARITVRHGLQPRMLVVGSEGHHVPHRFQALVERQHAAVTIELELACEARKVPAAAMMIAVEGVHQVREPNGEPLTAQSTRVPLQSYANAAADLIAYIQLSDPDGMEWLVPRWVNEPIAQLIPLSWMPDREPILRPAVELDAADEVSPGLYSLDGSSFVRALRVQQRPTRRGRPRAIPEDLLPKVAAIYNEARAARLPPIPHVSAKFPHHSRSTIERAIAAARQARLIPPVGAKAAARTGAGHSLS